MNVCISKKTENGNWKIEKRNWKSLGTGLFLDARQANDEDQGIVGGGVELLQDSACGALRILARGNRFHKTSINAVGGEEESVSFKDGKNGGLERRQLFADNAAAEEKHLRIIRASGDHSRHSTHNIADAEPGHHAVIEINGGNAENDAASGLQRAVAFLDERDDRLIGAIRQNGRGGFCGAGGFFAVADAVNGGDEKAAGPDAEDVAITGCAFTGKREIGNTVFD